MSSLYAIAPAIVKNKIFLPGTKDAGSPVFLFLEETFPAPINAESPILLSSFVESILYGTFANVEIFFAASIST